MSETKLTCPVVRDLLPLYQDWVVEEETRALVEGHLEGCPDCRGRLEALRGELPEVAAPLDNAAGAELVRREKKLSTCWAVVLTLAAGFFALLILAVFCGIDGPMVKVDPSLIEVVNVRVGDDTVDVDNQYEIEYIMHGKHCGYGDTHVTYSSEAILEVEIRRPLFSLVGGHFSSDRVHEVSGSNEKYHDLDIRVIVINGEVVWTAEKGILERELG